jgi:hypothetical protein
LFHFLQHLADEPHFIQAVTCGWKLKTWKRFMANSNYDWHQEIREYGSFYTYNNILLVSLYTQLFLFLVLLSKHAEMFLSLTEH